MFPRYIFLEEPYNWDKWDEIREQSGIAGFATNSNKLAKIPGGEIERLKREGGELIDGSKSARIIFNIGEEIGITSGPFASFPGIVEENLDIPLSDLDPETRLIVLVNIFGRSTRTELEIWQVAKRD
jgi:transcriptional antiterminator NusG